MQKFDHIAIYWLITGTYAPLMLGALHSRPAYWLLGALFALSIAGTVGKLCFANKFHKFEVAIYLLMGWCCLFVIKPLYTTMPPASFKFLLAGGIAIFTLPVTLYPDIAPSQINITAKYPGADARTVMDTVIGFGALNLLVLSSMETFIGSSASAAEAHSSTSAIPSTKASSKRFLIILSRSP